MAKPGDAKSSGGSSIRFSPLQLLWFSLVLILAGSVVGAGFLNFGQSRSLASSTGASQNSSNQEIPAWGELIKNPIWLDRPQEFFSNETGTNQIARWIFSKLTVEQVRTLLASCGLSADQVNRALTPGRFTVAPTGTTILPEDELVFSLTPNVRATLYQQLAPNPANGFYSFPFLFQGDDLDEPFLGSGLDAALIAQAKKLIYRRGRTLCFSDLVVLMRAAPAEKDRLALVKALSRQPAMLVRLRIREHTDVDKILGYWSKGVVTKDARPLLESLTRTPDGGTVSLLYLLPHFARDRVFTFPKPPAPGQLAPDCHWSSLNFFNEVPDDRFSDGDFSSRYIQSHYYPIAKPNLYGDLVTVVSNGKILVHSAVYLADDIVFTKNGSNLYQPWTLMRMADLLNVYSMSGPVSFSFYRQNGL